MFEEANMIDVHNRAKNILIRLTEDRQNVTYEEVLFLIDYLNGNCTANKEDVGIVLETYLQENDLHITDELKYYQNLMEK